MLLLNKISKWVLIVCALFVVTSCGYKDIDKRAFVVTIGIDKAENTDKKYKVMLKIAVPSPNVKEGEPEFIVPEHESNTISDGIRMIKTKVSKELDFSQAKAIVFGEELVNEDFQGVLDWFVRRRDIQKIAWLSIGKPNAKEVLKLKRKTERLPSESIFLTYGATGTESPFIVSEYLFDFRKRMTERGVDPTLPVMEVKKEYFQIDHAAVFDNKRVKLDLSADETKLLNILLNRVKKVDFKVIEEGEEKYAITSDTLSVDYGITKGKSPEIRVLVEVQGVLEEVLGSQTADPISEAEKIAGKQYSKEVKDLLEKLKEEGLDPVGFGLKYRAQSFSDNDWEEWKRLYPEIPIHVEVKFTIQGTGVID
ncbi:Ger(x)C family spore germination protein [Radiobacillus deserti]|uniref:Ger(X)C family spore germination protein n=1 Tax=Radiobacillus deserti TaxID=2594883 RepID=A0A516KK63_9BACI|nr:Ger(x)C family spore germination protein [Radiobacillus deserti]QDP41767.1 Ger(x)C family spore germination protein [Radiobacillus deserti]